LSFSNVVEPLCGYSREWTSTRFNSCEIVCDYFCRWTSARFNYVRIIFTDGNSTTA